MTSKTAALRPAQPTSDEREVRLIYVGICLLLLGIYLWSVLTLSALQQPRSLAAFTALMLTHAGLHWASQSFERFGIGGRGLALYLFIQGTLALMLVSFTVTSGTTFSLYMVLAAEAVGLFGQRTRQAILAVAGCLLYSGITILVVRGWDALPGWLVLAVPQTFFISAMVHVYIRQALARQQTQALLSELATTHRQLQTYAAQVEDLTLAAERQRMARELHDTLAQGLAGLILQLEAVDAHLEHGRTERAQTIIKQAMARARTSLGEARHAIDDLRADETLSRTLADAVRDEVERFTSATSIHCDLSLALPPTLPPLVREQAYRAVAEGLSNIARHARARSVQLQLGTSNGCLTLLLRDDGVGFELPAVARRSGHYGLIGLRERARLAGGTFELTSTPGQGTEICLHLPLSTAAGSTQEPNHA
jgi:NarL family two-component system sensor histidine kinase YdfH